MAELVRKDPRRTFAGELGGRRPGVQLQARARSRCRLLDLAAGAAGPAAPAGRGDDRAAGRSQPRERRGSARRASRPCRRALRSECRRRRAHGYSSEGRSRLRGGGDAASSLHSNAEAASHYERALRIESNLGESWRASVLESLGDVAFRSGRVDDAMAAWTEAMEMHGERGERARIAELHRKIGLGHWQKGDRDPSIVNFQQGIDLLKSGEPCREARRNSTRTRPCSIWIPATTCSRSMRPRRRRCSRKRSGHRRPPPGQASRSGGSSAGSAMSIERARVASAPSSWLGR